MLKQDASIFVALPVSSTTHTGLYTVASKRGVANPGVWQIGVASSVGVAASSDREIDCPISRNLVGVDFNLLVLETVGRDSSEFGEFFVMRLFLITSVRQ